MVGRLRLAFLVLLFGLCSACSSFDSRWKTAAHRPGAERWEGRWTSEKHRNSHGDPMGGRLRAVVDPGPGHGLAVDFHANWLIFASDYTVTLEPKSGGASRSGEREYSGTHELPKMFGGIYHYQARVAGDRFDARYTSSYDHGKFTLQRILATKDYDSGHARH